MNARKTGTLSAQRATSAPRERTLEFELAPFDSQEALSAGLEGVGQLGSGDAEREVECSSRVGRPNRLVRPHVRRRRLP